ncbi:conserved Plasmodium protein, unknown function [Plasmodium ovale curtisi]|uniref:RTR1-type domain-containing protein n=1 Tax=Plasmodium ovale curtisi TaxID=864141 RepID=A0A1A8WN38_PLAOA|nr:conserved Plasmodium protein, unknown function [Plasmodium ovale curtisi]
MITGSRENLNLEREKQSNGQSDTQSEKQKDRQREKERERKLYNLSRVYHRKFETLLIYINIPRKKKGKLFYGDFFSNGDICSYVNTVQRSEKGVHYKENCEGEGKGKGNCDRDRDSDSDSDCADVNEKRNERQATNEEWRGEEVKADRDVYIRNLMIYLNNMIALYLSKSNLIDVCINRRSYNRCGFYACENTFLNNINKSKYKIDVNSKNIYLREYYDLFCSTNCMNTNLLLLKEIICNAKTSNENVNLRKKCQLIHIMFLTFFPFFKMYDISFLLNNIHLIKFQNDKIYVCNGVGNNFDSTSAYREKHNQEFAHASEGNKDITLEKVCEDTLPKNVDGDEPPEKVDGDIPTVETMADEPPKKADGDIPTVETMADEPSKKADGDIPTGETMADEPPKKADGDIPTVETMADAPPEKADGDASQVERYTPGRKKKQQTVKVDKGKKEKNTKIVTFDEGVKLYTYYKGSRIYECTFDKICINENTGGMEVADKKEISQMQEEADTLSDVLDKTTRKCRKENTKLIEEIPDPSVKLNGVEKDAIEGGCSAFPSNKKQEQLETHEEKGGEKRDNGEVPVEKESMYEEEDLTVVENAQVKKKDECFSDIEIKEIYEQVRKSFILNGKYTFDNIWQHTAFDKTKVIGFNYETKDSSIDYASQKMSDINLKYNKEKEKKKIILVSSTGEQKTALRCSTGAHDECRDGEVDEKPIDNLVYDKAAERAEGLTHFIEAQKECDEAEVESVPVEVKSGLTEVCNVPVEVNSGLTEVGSDPCEVKRDPSEVMHDMSEEENDPDQLDKTSLWDLLMEKRKKIRDMYIREFRKVTSAHLDSSSMGRCAEGKQCNGEVLNENFPSGELPNGKLLSGEVLNEKLLSSELPNGKLLGGELLNGKLLGGELLNGKLLGGELLNGKLPSEEVPNGKLPNDELPSDEPLSDETSSDCMHSDDPHDNKYVYSAHRRTAYEDMSLYVVLWDIFTSNISKYTVHFFKKGEFIIPISINEMEKERKNNFLQKISEHIPEYVHSISSIILNVCRTFQFFKPLLPFKNVIYKSITCVIASALKTYKAELIPICEMDNIKKAEEFLMDENKMDEDELNDLSTLFFHNNFY